MHELTAEEFRKGSKLTPAIPSGFKAIYYELQIVLEVMMLPKGISLVPGILMNSKSATYNVFQALRINPMMTARQHPFTNSRNPTSRSQQTTTSRSSQRQRYNNELVVIESNCAAKALRLLPMKRYSALRRCIIDQDIPVFRSCPVSSVLLPEAPQAIHLANGVYYLISRNPTKDIKDDSRTQGFSLFTIDCLACVLRSSCKSTIYNNQGDPVLSPDMDACKTTPEPYIATIKLAPPLNQVFQYVPFERLNFKLLHWCHPKSIPESVQLELTETPDGRRMDSETFQKLTEPIVAHNTSLDPATAAALDNLIPAKTSFIISAGSDVLSLFLFILNFPFFHRQARALCGASRRFLKENSGHIIHVPDDIDADSDSLFPIITREELTALRALAKEALLKIEANAPYTDSAEDEEKMYPDITAENQNHSDNTSVGFDYLKSDSSIYIRYPTNNLSISISSSNVS